MITRALIVMCFVLVPSGIFAQCQASFSYQLNGLTATFTGNVMPAPSPNTSFYWWFSDNGSYSQMQNPTYTFSNPGIYTVCFSYYDPANQCQDSVCQNVTVGNVNCSADFTWLDTLGYTYFISTNTAGPGATYYWDFGDGNYSNQQNPSHMYLNNGSYNVCLYVYDSMQVFCDSTCHTVLVQSVINCNADFTYIDSLGYVFFMGSSTLGSTGYYIWDFGDGGYSYQQNPSWQYNVAGWYTVCLQVYDSNQVFCDSTCHSLLVQQVSVNENALQNSIGVSPNPADDALQITFTTASTGNAAVTFYDAAGRVTATQTSPVNQSGFNKLEINTTQMPQGIYLMKLEINGAVAWKKIALTHQ